MFFYSLVNLSPFLNIGSTLDDFQFVTKKYRPIYY